MSRSAVLVGLRGLQSSLGPGLALVLFLVSGLGLGLFGCKPAKETEVPERSRSEARRGSDVSRRADVSEGPDIPKSCQTLREEVCGECSERSELCQAMQRVSLEDGRECEKAVELVRNEKRVGGIPAELCASSPKSEKEMYAFLGGEGSGQRAKVNCEQMCKRTFLDCLGVVLVASGQLTEEKIAKVKKAGMMKDMKKQGHEACMKQCVADGGVGKDAAAINRCLKNESCEEYADCVKNHLH